MLTRYWRHILFFCFVAAFLVSAPVVVLYTAGYRYYFDSGKIVQTGVLNVNSLPKDAHIYIDDRLFDERTPAVINNIVPGSHMLRVEKDGYSSWKKTLDVYSKQSTFATDIVLFLDQPPEKLTDAPEPPAINPSWQPVKPNFVVQNTNERSVLSRLDQNQVASIVAYLPLSNYQFVAAPSPFVLLHDDVRGRIVLVDIKPSEQPILLNTDATKWDWSREGDALLFTDGFDIEVYIPSSHMRETITRFSQTIQALRWYPQRRMAVFAYGGDIFAQELDRRGQTNKTTLVEGMGVKEFWFENEGEWLVGTTEDDEGFKKRLQR